MMTLLQMLTTLLEVSVKQNLYRLETEGGNRALPRPTISWYYTLAAGDLDVALKALNAETYDKLY